MRAERVDGDSVICPRCDKHHGDCWEWVTTELPNDMECEGCGLVFQYWAEFDVTYHSEASFDVPELAADPDGAPGEDPKEPLDGAEPEGGVA